MAAASSGPAIGHLAASFRRFSENECPGSSPLYGVLAAAIAQDPGLLALAQRVRAGQPPVNMLFAAVYHQLLFGDTGHELARYYPDMAARPEPVEGAFDAFRDFCRRYEIPITDLIGRRVVSTNEVQRCACLMPAFRWVASRYDAERLHLIEVGASAGFNLMWDHYAYDYGAAAPFVLRCDVKNGHGLDGGAALPAVGQRVGIDPFAIDIGDEEDRQWLRALVWPEHTERAERMRFLIDWMTDNRPDVIKGDGIEELARVIGGSDTNGQVCVFHSFVLNQFPPEAKARFHERLRVLADERPVVRVAMEWDRTAGAVILDAERHHAYDSDRTVLATCDAHGRWLDWAGA